MGFLDFLEAPFKAVGSAVGDVVAPLAKATTGVMKQAAAPLTHAMDDATHVATGAQKMLGGTVQSLGRSAEQTLQPLTSGVGQGVSKLGGGLGGGLEDIGGGIGGAMKYLPFAGAAVAGLWLYTQSKRDRDPIQEMMQMQMEQQMMKRQKTTP